MSARGFTLFELLMVLVLLGLMAGIAVPRLSNAFTGPSVRAAALDVAATLRAARSEAVTGSTATLLRYDPAVRRMAIGNRYRGAPMDANLRIDVVSIDDGRPVAGIAFFPDGSSSGGQIVLSEDRQGFVVVVDWLTGRASIHDR